MHLDLKEHQSILFLEKEINQQRDLKMTKITVFGMGSFGTALANVLAQNGHDVLMWGKITIV